MGLTVNQRLGRFDSYMGSHIERSCMFWSRENDTDLGDECWGREQPEYSDHDYEEYYRFKFKNETELMKSSFFQEALNKTLLFKEKEIESLRNELLRYLK